MLDRNKTTQVIYSQSHLMTIKHHKKLVVTLDDEQDGDEQGSKKMIPSFLIYTPQRPSPSLANTGSREEATWWAAPRVGGARGEEETGAQGRGGGRGGC